MKIQYENKYGTLELEPLEYRHVSTVLHATTPDDLKFDFETAERIALITENRHIQLAFVTKPCRALVVHHESPDTVAVLPGTFPELHRACEMRGKRLNALHVTKAAPYEHRRIPQAVSDRACLA